MIYTIVLIIHLLCAIVFLGYVFAEVFILPAMKKVLNEKEHKTVMDTLSSRARAIFPVSVLVLILTGGFMLSKYVNSELGFFTTPLQQLLMLKVLLAFMIAGGILYSLSRRVLKKKPHPIMKYFHKFVLVAGLLIVVLAKLIFVV